MPSNTASLLPPPSIASILPSSGTSSIVNCQSILFRVSDLFISLSFVFQRFYLILGHEITQGVKSSTLTVRLAEERLRRLTNMNPPGFEEFVENIEDVKTDKLKKNMEILI
ncbi:unnamed protein product [Lactuca saligna]|uniref:Uncharacterized protein n=1 Tax=Lactuca saligna TaxID=75948 RepID=A0AA36A579_LACSI|nr:unnamed protein product [Lactuca saligna]